MVDVEMLETTAPYQILLSRAGLWMTWMYWEYPTGIKHPFSVNTHDNAGLPIQLFTRKLKKEDSQSPKIVYRVLSLSRHFWLRASVRKVARVAPLTAARNFTTVQDD
jgi:hypothetical protein